MLVFIRDRYLFVITTDKYITVLAPAVGILLALTIEASLKHIKHQKRFNNQIFKLGKPIETITYNPIRDKIKRVTIAKVSYFYKKILVVCDKVNDRLIFWQWPIPFWLNVSIAGIWKVTEGAAVARAARILYDTALYLFWYKTNVLRTVSSTLIWSILADRRALIYKLAFLGVSLSVAIIWTNIPNARKILRVVVSISMFNLFSNLRIVEGTELWLEYGPQITTFGLPQLPIIERPIQEFKPNIEQLETHKVILPGNETELIFSSPRRNEIRENISTDVNTETSDTSKNSILDEEEKLVVKKEITTVPKKETKIKPKTEKKVLVQEELRKVLKKKTRILPKKEAILKPKAEVAFEPQAEKILDLKEDVVLDLESILKIIESTEGVSVEPSEKIVIESTEGTNLKPAEKLRKTDSTSKIEQRKRSGRTTSLADLKKLDKHNPKNDEISGDIDDNVPIETNSTQIRIRTGTEKKE